MKILCILILLCASLQVVGKEKSKQEDILLCQSTREYVTTLEYLREHKEFSIKENDARKIASEVTKGCTGAAKRFIRISNLLIAAKSPTAAALKTAKRFALEHENVADNFVDIFRKAYREKELDLSLKASLDMALALSIEIDENKDKVFDDFKKLVEFCVDTDSLDLPKAKCAKFAMNVAKSGQQYKKPVSGPFIDLFDFIRSSDGPAVPLFKALQSAESAIKFGPMAKDNFIQAYKYAVSKSGLDYDRSKAMKFATEMASRSAGCVSVDKKIKICN